MAEVLARRQSEAVGLIVGRGDRGIAVGEVDDGLAVQCVKLSACADAASIGFGDKQTGKGIWGGAICVRVVLVCDGANFGVAGGQEPGERIVSEISLMRTILDDLL